MLIPILLGEAPVNIWAVTNPGSGNTISYAVAILSRIDCTKNHTQALYVVASYEAAAQTAHLIAKLGIYKNVKIGLAIRSDKCKCDLNYFKIESI